MENLIFTDGKKLFLFVLAMGVLIFFAITSHKNSQNIMAETECRDGILYYTYSSNGARDLTVKIDKHSLKPMLCE